MIGRTDQELLMMGERSAGLGVRWNPSEWARTAISFLPHLRQASAGKA